MTTLQVLNLNIADFYAAITAFIGIVYFVFWYKREAKKMATMNDLKESEKRLKDADDAIVHRVERIEDQIREDIAEIKESMRVIHNHIINCKK